MATQRKQPRRTRERILELVGRGLPEAEVTRRAVGRDFRTTLALVGVGRHVGRGPGALGAR